MAQTIFLAAHIGIPNSLNINCTRLASNESVIESKKTPIAYALSFNIFATALSPINPTISDNNSPSYFKAFTTRVFFKSYGSID